LVFIIEESELSRRGMALDRYRNSSSDEILVATLRGLIRTDTLPLFKITTQKPSQGGMIMRKEFVLIIGLTLVSIGLVCSGISREATAPPSENLLQAVNTVRLINTAQARMGLAGKNFLTFPELLSTGALREVGKTNEDLSSAYDRLDLRNQAEPLNGFDFDMVVAPEGRAYKLSLAQKKECGIAVFSDNRGLIYYGKIIGCPNK
jgi:hypothetical protein